MGATRKEISFDLDTKKLADYYDNVSTAYYELQRELKNVGFLHRQGSVYNSIEPMNIFKVYKSIDKVCKKLPWLAECAKSMDVTSIGKIHDLLGVIKKYCNYYENDRINMLEKRKSKHKNR